MTEPTPTPPTPAPEAPRRADALPRGTVVAGCEIGRIVAESSFSIVYYARDPKTERRFAIKEYLPVSLALRSDDGRTIALRAPDHAEAFERGLDTFAAEAELLERLNHPSLLRVLRSWRGHGTIYRVMPWLEGETLLNLRRSLTEPPDEATLRLMLVGLLGALQTLHEAGQVHGAISPAHVMVLADDRPMLMDTAAVGRALVGDQTRALMAMVAPGYAPPGAGQPGADLAQAQAADVRALAAVAHFAITGELPAAGDRPPPLAAALRRLRGRPSYSAAMLDTIEAALADDPARRFTTVAALRTALVVKPTAPQIVLPTLAEGSQIDPSEPYLAAAASSTRPADVVPSGYRSRRADARRRRNRVLTWLGAGALATLAVGAIGLVVINERAAVELRARSQTAPADDLPSPAARPVEIALPPTAAGPAPTVAAPRPAPEPAPIVAAKPEPAAAPALPPPAAPLPEPPRAAVKDPTLAILAAPAATPTRPAKTPSTPVKMPPRPVKEAAAPAAPPGPASPREVCGARTEFALYRCMTTECQRPTWRNHAQCERLRTTDEIE